MSKNQRLRSPDITPETLEEPLKDIIQGRPKFDFRKYFGRLEKEHYGCNLFEMIQSLSSYSGSEDGEKSSDLNNV